MKKNAPIIVIVLAIITVMSFGLWAFIFWTMSIVLLMLKFCFSVPDDSEGEDPYIPEIV